MTEPTELLACPFCGAAAHFEMDEERWEWVECESCGMQGNRSTSLMEDCKPKLAEAWNRRTPAPVEAEPLIPSRHGCKWCGKTTGCKHTQQPAPTTQQAGIPGNFITHRAAWREALETAKFFSTGVDRSYWDHELAAFDRSFDRLWTLMQDAPQPSHTAQPAPVQEDAHALLQDVAACFTRDDDLPDNLLPRIDAVLAARKQGEKQ